MTDSSKRLSVGQAVDELSKILGGLSENERTIALKAACEITGITIPAGNERSKTDGMSSPLTEIPGQSHSNMQSLGVIDIRSLKEKKAPATDTEMTCLVAYYLKYEAPVESRKDQIGIGDLEENFRLAGFPLPKALQQTLVNTKAAGYVDSVGRGAYKLNPVGYNLVVHSLPRKVENSRKTTTVRKRQGKRKSKPKRK